MVGEVGDGVYAGGASLKSDERSEYIVPLRCERDGAAKEGAAKEEEDGVYLWLDGAYDRPGPKAYLDCPGPDVVDGVVVVDEVVFRDGKVEEPPSPAACGSGREAKFDGCGRPARRLFSSRSS